MFIFKFVYFLFKTIFIEIYSLFKYAFLSLYYILMLILFIPKMFINILANFVYAIYLKVKKINLSISRFFEKMLGRIKRNLRYKYNNLTIVKNRKNRITEKERQIELLNSTKTIFKVMVSNTTDKPINVKSVNVEVINKNGKVIEKLLEPIGIILEPKVSKEISVKSKQNLSEDVTVKYTINK